MNFGTYYLYMTSIIYVLYISMYCRVIRSTGFSTFAAFENFFEYFSHQTFASKGKTGGTSFGTWKSVASPRQIEDTRKRLFRGETVKIAHRE